MPDLNRAPGPPKGVSYEQAPSAEGGEGEMTESKHTPHTTAEAISGWFANSLRSYARELRDSEARARKRFKPGHPYRDAAFLLADLYAEAAMIFERELGIRERGG